MDLDVPFSACRLPERKQVFSWEGFDLAWGVEDGKGKGECGTLRRII